MGEKIQFLNEFHCGTRYQYYMYFCWDCKVNVFILELKKKKNNKKIIKS